MTNPRPKLPLELPISVLLITAALAAAAWSSRDRCDAYAGRWEVSNAPFPAAPLQITCNRSGLIVELASGYRMGVPILAAEPVYTDPTGKQLPVFIDANGNMHVGHTTLRRVSSK